MQKSYIKRNGGAAGLFLMGALFGMMLLEGMSALWQGDAGEESEPSSQEPAASVQTQREEALTQDATAEWAVRFSYCGHETQQSKNEAISGMTRRQLASAYPEYTVELFGGSVARLVKTVEGYCPEHYVLCVNDEGALAITRMDAATLAQRELMRVEADASSFDEQTLAALRQGIPFTALAEINEYLEGNDETIDN